MSLSEVGPSDVLYIYSKLTARDIRRCTEGPHLRKSAYTALCRGIAHCDVRGTDSRRYRRYFAPGKPALHCDQRGMHFSGYDGHILPNDHRLLPLKRRSLNLDTNNVAVLTSSRLA